MFKRFHPLLLIVAGSCLGCGDKPPATIITAPASLAESGTVTLGSPWLTAGIPGEGPLTTGEIKAWLQQPLIHKPLALQVPAWLTEDLKLRPLDVEEPITLAQIELGRQLFFDKRLSGYGTFSCATCHQPRQAMSSYQVMPEVERNVSAVFNRILGESHFWDGRADSLASQPHSPITNPFEMNSSPESTTATVASIEGYNLQFEAIYGEVTFENISRALAAFETVIVTGPSLWDQHRMLRHERAQVAGRPAEKHEPSSLQQQADESPLSAAALRGADLFFGERAQCSTCHTGPNLTDELFHNLGVEETTGHVDAGRMEVTGRESDRGAFKTPSLRNVSQTPPYMHNGRFAKLRDVIEVFNQGGGANVGLSPVLRPLNLTSAEKADLVAFLQSLNSPLPPIETERLPQ